ncbi:MAG: DegT/DnrJ/EryC1/StrS family aminotransferase [Candidatus Scalindua sp.]|nr:DegT/DnrJ/EryC1/StrS family aminotransferase [Candidatus Scalindua sp.]
MQDRRDSSISNHVITHVPLIDLKRQYRNIKEEILSSIEQVLESQSFILGPQVEEFEKLMASYCNTKHAIGVSSGTDALFLALRALEIGSGDEVITTPFTFFATAGSICNAGATPVFVDIDPESYNVSADLIKKRITKKTKAIIPVHLYGQCADMEPISEIAKEYNLKVIEDAAQAIGAEYKNRKAGSIGDLGCFSFFPSKNLGGFGDGGMITCDSDELAEKIYLLRVHGGKTKNYYSSLGINGRLDTLQASILITKLRYLDQWNENRRQKASYYMKQLDEANVTLPKTMPFNKHVFHLFVIRSKERDELLEFLRANKIDCFVHYPIPQHLQECLKFLGYQEGDMPEAEKAAKEVLAIPLFPEITYGEQDYVIKTVKAFYSSMSKIN